MEKTIFEKMGGTYEQQGDYFIPCLTLATDQMLWVQRMNNIRNRATEIVNVELISV